MLVCCKESYDPSKFIYSAQSFLMGQMIPLALENSAKALF